MNFSEYLWYFREKKGLSQQDLADRLQITNRTISAIEKGTNPPFSPQVLKRFIDEFGLEHHKSALIMLCI